MGLHDNARCGLCSRVYRTTLTCRVCCSRCRTRYTTHGACWYCGECCACEQQTLNGEILPHIRACPTCVECLGPNDSIPLAQRVSLLSGTYNSKHVSLDTILLWQEDDGEMSRTLRTVIDAPVGIKPEYVRKYLHTRARAYQLTRVSFAKFLQKKR